MVFILAQGFQSCCSYEMMFCSHGALDCSLRGQRKEGKQNNSLIPWQVEKSSAGRPVSASVPWEIPLVLLHFPPSPLHPSMRGINMSAVLGILV